MVCCHGYVPYRTVPAGLGYAAYADCPFCRENLEKDGMGVRGLAGSYLGWVSWGCRIETGVGCRCFVGGSGWRENVGENGN